MGEFPDALQTLILGRIASVAFAVGVARELGL
jgi:hypothetical protein